jgi:uncharacterized phage protein (TIGR01671 family)
MSEQKITVVPKFRAWDNIKKEMFKDTFAITESGQVVVVEQEFVTSTPDYIFVEHLVIMQSTGLEDKNNKEIFEGDIVRMRNPRDRRQIGMFQVVRVANSPMLGLLDKKLTTEIFNLYEHMRNYYEIIGNIYENPELLGQ